MMNLCETTRKFLSIMTRRQWSITCHGGKFSAYQTAEVTLGRQRAMGSVAVMTDDLDNGFRADPITAVLDAEEYVRKQETKS